MHGPSVSDLATRETVSGFGSSPAPLGLTDYSEAVNLGARYPSALTVELHEDTRQRWGNKASIPASPNG